MGTCLPVVSSSSPEPISNIVTADPTLFSADVQWPAASCRDSSGDFDPFAQSGSCYSPSSRRCKSTRSCGLPARRNSVSFPVSNRILPPESVRKSPEKTSTDIKMDFSVEKWVSEKIPAGGIEHPKEFLAETSRFSLIPRIGGKYIFLDVRKKPQRVCHFLCSILSRKPSRVRRCVG